MEETFQALVKTGPIESWVEFTFLDIPVTFALLLGRPWFHALGGVPSTVHQKRKFPHEGEVVTIESGAAIAAVQVAQKEVQAPTGFQVAGIYQDYMDPKVSRIIKKIHFLPGLGLGKTQQGIAEFPDFKGQVTRERIGYEGNGPVKKKARKGLTEHFIQEGKGYPYTGAPKPVMVAGVKMPGFFLFKDLLNSAEDEASLETRLVNQMKSLVIQEEEELLEAPLKTTALVFEATSDLATLIFENLIDVF